MATDLDYRAYNMILEQADTLVRKGGKDWTRVDALHALMQAYPEDPAYAVAFRRYAGIRQPITKQTEHVPPPRASDQLLALAKAYQEEHGCDFLTASNQITKAQPELLRAYLWEAQHPGQPPRPVTKAATLTIDQAVQQARTHAQESGETTEQALMEMGQQHGGVYYEAYRKFRLTDEAIDARLEVQKSWGRRGEESAYGRPGH